MDKDFVSRWGEIARNEGAYTRKWLSEYIFNEVSEQKIIHK
jgi:hypothetical protein